MAAMPPVSVSVIGKTDIGCKRSNNEDAFGIRAIGSSWLAIVADGMGGHHGGEIASELVVQCFLDETERRLKTGEQPLGAMQAAAQLAQIKLRERARQEPELNKMGTTLVACYLADGKASIIHAGDSRCYLHDGQALAQLTRDDTVIQQMIDTGAVTAADVVNSPFRSVLTNSLSAGQDKVSFSRLEIPLSPGLRILLCSDGLMAALATAQFGAILANRQLTIAACVDQLVQQCLAHGAPDNVTVVVVEVSANA